MSLRPWKAFKFFFAAILFFSIIWSLNPEEMLEEEKTASLPKLSLERDVIKEIAFNDKKRPLQLLLEGKISEVLFEKGEGHEALREVDGILRGNFKIAPLFFSCEGLKIFYNDFEMTLENFTFHDHENIFRGSAKAGLFQKEKNLFSFLGEISLMAKDAFLLAERGTLQLEQKKGFFFGSPCEWMTSKGCLSGNELSFALRENLKIKNLSAHVEARFTAPQFSLTSSFVEVNFDDDEAFSLVTGIDSSLFSHLQDSLWEVHASEGFFLKEGFLQSFPGRVHGHWLNWEFEGNKITFNLDTSSKNFVKSIVLEGDVALKEKEKSERKILCQKMEYSDAYVLFDGEENRVLFQDGEFNLSAPKILCAPNGSFFKGIGEVRCEFSEKEWQRLKLKSKKHDPTS